MTWAMLIPLIVEYGPQGISLAESLWQKWSSGSAPTQKDFDDLRALASQTAADRLKAQLTAKGIPLDSDQAKTLLALVS